MSFDGVLGGADGAGTEVVVAGGAVVGVVVDPVAGGVASAGMDTGGAELSVVGEFEGAGVDESIVPAGSTSS